MIDSSIQAIIFDCDGTLVDSEPVTAGVLSDCLKDVGFEMTQQDALRLFVGRDMPGIMTVLESMMKQPLPEGFVVDFRARQAIALKTDLKAIEGAFELMESVARPYCIASNAPQDKIRINLEVTGLDAYFQPDRTFSAYDIQCWKPDPALFLHAAQSIEVAPAHCLVIEDSAAGIDAGLAAGMQVVGYCCADSQPPSDRVPFVRSLRSLIGKL